MESTRNQSETAKETKPEEKGSGTSLLDNESRKGTITYKQLQAMFG